MAREPQLTDHELRLLRGMMDEYTQRRAVDAWVNSRWRFVIAVAGLVASSAVITASVIEIARTLG